MPHEVFITYSSHDKPYADAICHGLESAGVGCWIAPRDILPSSVWAEAIIDAISASRLLIVVFSGHANASPQVIREVERAVNRRIPVIPVRVEDVSPSKAMEYFLSSPHWLDALTEPLEEHIGRLVSIVRTLLQKEETEQPGIRAESESSRFGGPENVQRQSEAHSRESRRQIRSLLSSPASFFLPKTRSSTPSGTGKYIALLCVLVVGVIAFWGIRQIWPSGNPVSPLAASLIVPSQRATGIRSGELDGGVISLRARITRARALREKGAYSAASRILAVAASEADALASRYPRAPRVDSVVSDLLVAMRENAAACASQGQLLRRRGITAPACK